jgi:oxygen-independent coproporphyrinogen-3 oxidase
MGYTASKTKLMIGLGASSISDSWYGFAQNVKSVEEYQHLVANDVIPIFKGHVLTKEDQVIRKHILNLMCNFETSWFNEEMFFPDLPFVLDELKELEKDGLVEITPRQLKVNQAGKPFIRNICMAFDLKLHEKTPDTRLFSMTI